MFFKVSVFREQGVLVQNVRQSQKIASRRTCINLGEILLGMPMTHLKECIAANGGRYSLENIPFCPFRVVFCSFNIK